MAVFLAGSVPDLRRNRFTEIRNPGRRAETFPNCGCMSSYASTSLERCCPNRNLQQAAPSPQSFLVAGTSGQLCGVSGRGLIWVDMASSVYPLERGVDMISNSQTFSKYLGWLRRQGSLGRWDCGCRWLFRVQEMETLEFCAPSLLCLVPYVQVSLVSCFARPSLLSWVTYDDKVDRPKGKTRTRNPQSSSSIIAQSSLD